MDSLSDSKKIVLEPPFFVSKQVFWRGSSLLCLTTVWISNRFRNYFFFPTVGGPSYSSRLLFARGNAVAFLPVISAFKFRQSDFTFSLFFSFPYLFVLAFLFIQHCRPFSRASRSSSRRAFLVIIACSDELICLCVFCCYLQGKTTWKRNLETPERTKAAWIW